MSENLKDCEHCRFSIPRTAEVCGHCGRNVAYPVSEVDKSLKTRLYRGFIADGGKFGLAAAVVCFFGPEGSAIRAYKIPEQTLSDVIFGDLPGTGLKPSGDVA